MANATNQLAGRTVAVIGAGPIGLEAGLLARSLGATVRIYEAGSVAQSVAEWGHIELFTPFEMNHTPLGRRALESAGRTPPPDDAVQMAAEWRESYLLPLAAETPLAESIVSGARVITTGRGPLLKGDHIGDGARRLHPFRLLIDERGAERYEEADIVLDCSGSWHNPNWLGVGGVPAVGERECRGRIAYHPVDVAGERARYSGRKILLVGDGLSAATTALALAELSADAPETRCVWVTRDPAPVPIAPIANDPLTRRAALTNAANRLAAGDGRALRWMPGVRVKAIHWSPDEAAFDVILATPDGEREERFEEVIANVGYEPDDGVYRQLQVHECYASRAPMKLAASLLAASAEAGGDCMKLGGFGPETLVNPEPDFFILGMKSYGRNSAFLLRTGYEQLRDAFSLLVARPVSDRAEAGIR